MLFPSLTVGCVVDVGLDKGGAFLFYYATVAFLGLIVNSVFSFCVETFAAFVS